MVPSADAPEPTRSRRRQTVGLVVALFLTVSVGVGPIVVTYAVRKLDEAAALRALIAEVRQPTGGTALADAMKRVNERRIGDRAARALLMILRDDETAEEMFDMKAAKEALCGLEIEAVPELVNALADERAASAVRDALFTMLDKDGALATVYHFAVHDPRPEVRKQLGQALASDLFIRELSYQQNRARPIDSELLAKVISSSEADFCVRLHAAALLARLDHRKAAIALPMLLEDMSSGDLMAARVVARIDPTKFPAVAGTLQELLTDSEQFVQVYAAIAFGEFGAEAKPAVPMLVQKLGDRKLDKRTRGCIVGSLARIGAATSSEEIMDLIIDMAGNDAEDRLREDAVISLRRFAATSPKALSALIKALQDRSSMARCLAADGLGELGAKAESAIPALEKALKDPQAAGNAESALQLIRSAIPSSAPSPGGGMSRQ
jgi:hypothetical protein